MVKNFDWLIANHGFIPNGNRTYYLSRSQPPFFSLMVELLAGIEGDDVYKAHLPALRAEHAYWMDETAATEHVVRMPDGGVLNRYYDRLDIPRQESWREDVNVAEKSKRAPEDMYRQLRSAAESGWDFSSRWFADGKSLATIRTTELIPVDLNCLLHHLEITIAKASRAAGDEAAAKDFEAKAAARKEAIERYCWSAKDRWYVDYDMASGKPGGELTLAGVAPLFFQLAPQDRAGAIAKTIHARFLRPGGVVTTLKNTGQQWDAPNGWAPLQWMTIQGLRNYRQDDLASDIAKRWISLNVKVYRTTGRLMEKYDVIDMTRESGGGEYPSQDGFGWTNGVLLKLIKLYGLPE
jgi:alpha,alpha-trehalase